jgi:hypothetical protein
MMNKQQDKERFFDRLKLSVGTAAAKAALPIAKRLEKGLKVEQVDNETYQLRLSICNACEHLTETNHCGRCFCPVEYKAKLAFNPYAAGVGVKTQVKCPEGKW